MVEQQMAPLWARVDELGGKLQVAQNQLAEKTDQLQAAYVAHQFLHERVDQLEKTRAAFLTGTPSDWSTQRLRTQELLTPKAKLDGGSGVGMLNTTWRWMSPNSPTFLPPSKGGKL